MTQDEIISLATEAGLCSTSNGFIDWIDAGPSLHEMTLFAKLVTEKAVRESSAEYRLGWNDGQIAEREACAEIAEKQRYAMNISLTTYPAQNGTAVEIFNQIRARKDKE